MPFVSWARSYQIRPVPIAIGAKIKMVCLLQSDVIWSFQAKEILIAFAKWWMHITMCNQIQNEGFFPSATRKKKVPVLDSSTGSGQVTAQLWLQAEGGVELLPALGWDGMAHLVGKDVLRQPAFPLLCHLPSAPAPVTLTLTHPSQDSCLVPSCQAGLGLGHWCYWLLQRSRAAAQRKRHDLGGKGCRGRRWSLVTEGRQKGARGSGTHGRWQALGGQEAGETGSRKSRHRHGGTEVGGGKSRSAGVKSLPTHPAPLPMQWRGWT